jgi:hypothetical protein
MRSPKMSNAFAVHLSAEILYTLTHTLRHHAARIPLPGRVRSGKYSKIGARFYKQVYSKTMKRIVMEILAARDITTQKMNTVDDDVAAEN